MGSKSDDLYPYYLKGSIIGHGSFSTVYLGKRLVDGRDVAIKAVPTARLTKKLFEALYSEISIMNSIKNRHIVKLFDVKKRNGMIYIIMEYCAGGDLSRLLRKTGIFDEELAFVYMRQLVVALKALRTKNIVHRDLKPHNILLSKPENSEMILKLGDFGLAKAIVPTDLAETLCGSPLYMAPEVLTRGKYDEKADLWSLGVIFYEMLFGRPPFSANSHIELQRIIQESGHVLIPERSEYNKDSTTLSYNVSTGTRSLLKRMLEKDPSHRISFDEFFNHPMIRPIWSPRDHYPSISAYEFTENRAHRIQSDFSIAVIILQALKTCPGHTFSSSINDIALLSLALHLATIYLERLLTENNAYTLLEMKKLDALIEFFEKHVTQDYQNGISDVSPLLLVDLAYGLVWATLIFPIFNFIGIRGINKGIKRRDKGIA